MANARLEKETNIQVISSTTFVTPQLTVGWIKANRVSSLPILFCQLTVEAPIPALRLQSQPWGSNPKLHATIPALRLQSQTWGSNFSLRASIPASWLQFNPCHKAPISATKLLSQPRGLIPASRLKYQPPGSPSLQTQILANIDHQRLWGCCSSHYKILTYTGLGVRYNGYCRPSGAFPLFGSLTDAGQTKSWWSHLWPKLLKIDKMSLHF